MNLQAFKILAAGMFSMLLSVAVAQQSITISGSGLGDVMIYRNLRPGYEYTVNTNYANHPRIAAVAWTDTRAEETWCHPYYSIEACHLQMKLFSTLFANYRYSQDRDFFHARVNSTTGENYDLWNKGNSICFGVRFKGKDRVKT